jgi:hypothetical protein
VLSKNHLDPSSYYSFGGPSFLHTIHVLVIQLALDPIIYMYTLGGLLSFVLSKNHFGPIIILYVWGPSYHPKERNVTKKQCFCEAYENLNFGRFHVLAALNLGTTHKTIFKVQLDSCVKSSCQSTHTRGLPWHYYAKHGFIRGEGILRE